VLIGTLVRREGRQFQPITPAGSSFGINAALAVLALVGAVLMGVEAAGLHQPQPLERDDMWLGLGFYLASRLSAPDLPSGRIARGTRHNWASVGVDPRPASVLHTRGCHLEDVREAWLYRCAPCRGFDLPGSYGLA
jgi:hypothetical protein